MTTSALADYAARLRCFMERSLAQGAAGGRSGEEEFNALALELHSLQFRQNAAYRLLCNACGIRPEQVLHWSQILPAPTSAFKELALTSLRPGERRVVFCSSGTTGRGASRHFHSTESLALYEASLWMWFRVQVAPGAGPHQLVVLTPPGTQAPNSSLVHMFETVSRECSGGTQARFCGRANNDGTWALDAAQVADALDQATRSGQPVLLMGTAFNYVHLLDAWPARARRFGLPPGSLLLETGGYKGRSRALAKEQLHQQLGEGLGLPPEGIVSEYGMSELSSQAYDTVTEAASVPSLTSGRRQFRFPPWARVQVVSPETGREVADGETGLIRIWDLANVWSVLAVQTEDLGVRRGDGFELIGRAALAQPRGCSLMAR